MKNLTAMHKFECIMTTTGFRLCTCAEFKDYDPADPLPQDRQIRAHLIKHGPVQPKITKTSPGRAFRSEW